MLTPILVITKQQARSKRIGKDMKKKKKKKTPPKHMVQQCPVGHAQDKSKGKVEIHRHRINTL